MKYVVLDLATTVEVSEVLGAELGAWKGMLTLSLLSTGAGSRGCNPVARNPETMWLVLKEQSHSFFISEGKTTLVTVSAIDSSLCSFRTFAHDCLTGWYTLTSRGWRIRVRWGGKQIRCTHFSFASSISSRDRWEWCPSTKRTTPGEVEICAMAGRNSFLNQFKKFAPSIHPESETPYRHPAGPPVVPLYRI